MAALRAIRDLHVGHQAKPAVLEGLVPEGLWPDGPDDRLVGAGDIAEPVADVRWAPAVSLAPVGTDAGRGLS